MAELVFEAEVACPAETVFDALVDLPGYGRWLTSSSAYAGTTEVSSDPVAAGTTYVETSPSGTRHGTVTELDRPSRVTFHQPMTMRPRLLGVIDIHVSYTLTPTADGTHVTRVVRLTLPWQLRLLQPLVLRQFDAESRRTMDALAAFSGSAA
jgi:uncharacterized protein YndB with AHSA1/START domain